MQPETLKKYQTRARNFYRDHCNGSATDSAQICAAMVALAPQYVSSSFRVLKNALAADQLARGNPVAAEAIRSVTNPVTAPGSTMPRKPRPRRVRSVSKQDVALLVRHLSDTGCGDEWAAVMLAYVTGARPCEMRSIEVEGNLVTIRGGKKSRKLKRGADRVLLIENRKALKAVTLAAERLRHAARSDTAIRDALRKACRQLWPRRTVQLTLRSLRHQLGANLKASSDSPRHLAYIMGHQSTESIDVYGDRRKGEGRKLYVAPANDADVESVRVSTRGARYGRSHDPVAVDFVGGVSDTTPLGRFIRRWEREQGSRQ